MHPLALRKRRFFRAGMAATLLLLIFSTVSDAQRHYNFFYGKVLDQRRGTGIPNVNFSFTGSRLGAISDKKGEFSFFIDTIPVTMIVSHVGYTTKRVLLDTTSYSLNLYLEPEIRELKEVEIRASVHEPFFKDDQFAVKDYEIDSGKVYLLVYRYYLSRAEVICKSEAGDTLARSAVLPFIIRTLLKDCLGYLHVLSHDSVFQLFRKDSVVHLIHPESAEKFEKILLNCVASTEQILYFKKHIELGTGIEFYGIDRKSRDRIRLSTVRDEQKAKMLRRNPDDLYLMLSGIPDDLDLFVNWNWTHKILYRPVKSALYKIGDFICIFNIPERQIEFYDMKGAYSYKIALKIDEKIEGRWSDEIVVDEVTGKAYTTFMRNGIFILYGIDLNTGALKKRLTFFHPYPEKIRIYNDFVYYLYDVPGTDDNKMLYRQKL
jgi:hypothetical protein